jgi:two-component system, cell cycle sensor histidine kinase and response regulator CckA
MAQLTSTSGGTILIVDDNESLRELITALLECEGFRALQAQNSQEAVEIWKSEKDLIDLLIADAVIPGRSGPQLALEFRSAKPNLKVIFSSGHEEGSIFETTQMVKNALFLRKPYSTKTLVDMVRSAMEKPA